MMNISAHAPSKSMQSDTYVVRALGFAVLVSLTMWAAIAAAIYEWS
ncbi:hypothetical protein [Sphingomonas sp. CFBP 13728]|nr:hypothetical protein [Sphingomonas sp. CFBP 13728]